MDRFIGAYVRGDYLVLEVRDDGIYEYFAEVRSPQAAQRLTTAMNATKED